MCGFVCVSGMKNTIIPEMRKMLAHRGPDYYGNVTLENFQLHHWRLSIIDIDERSNQPFFDNDYALVYNGELYNYLDLKQELIQSNDVNFITDSDSEVLFHGLKIFGTKFIERIQGIFAFSFYNKRSKELLVSRDALGVKPLYYSISSDNLFISSEINPIVRLLGKKISFDKSACIESLFFGYTSEESTIYENIFKLKPSTYIVFDTISNKIIEKEAYDNIAKPISCYCYNDFKKSLEDSIKAQMVSDVPIGVLNSGGIDSGLVSSLVATMSEDNIHSFTAEFYNQLIDEVDDASAISTRFKLIQHNVNCSSSLVGEEIKEVIEHNGEVLLHSNSVAIYLIAKQASAHVKVLLSGEGADELFEGYNLYKRIWIIKFFRSIPFLRKFMLKYLKLPKVYNNLLENHSLRDAVLAKYCCSDLNGFKTFCKSVDANWELVIAKRLSKIDSSLQNNKGSIKKVIKEIDKTDYLQPLLDRQDRMLMAHGIEGRVPFLDERMIRLSKSKSKKKLSNAFTTKRYLRFFFQEFTKIRGRKKIAFSTPLSEYIISLENRLDIEKGFKFIADFLSLEYQQLNIFYKKSEDQIKWNLLNLVTLFLRDEK